MAGMHWPGCSDSRYLVALRHQGVNDAVRHDPATRWIVGARRLRVVRLHRARSPARGEALSDDPRTMCAGVMRVSAIRPEAGTRPSG